MDRPTTTLRLDPIRELALGPELAAAIQAERDSLLNIVLPVLAALFTVPFVLVLTFSSVLGGGLPAPWLWTAALTGVWVLALGRSIPFSLRAGALVAILLGVAVLDIFISGLGGQSQLYLLALVLITTAFFGFRVGVAMLGVGLALALAAVWQIHAGNLIPYPTLVAEIESGRAWISMTLFAAVISLFISLMGYRLIHNTVLVLQRQRNLTDAIARERGLLEQRVAERTRALSLVAAVNRTLSNELDRDQLIADVVEQIQAAFGYYHVHIYLLDADGRTLRMAGGTGETGKVLLMGNHRLTLEQGLVGKAARTGQAIIVPDVAQSREWRPNPLLPETKSEVSIPLVISGRVVGVLDVQHNVAGYLTQRDADLLESVANQTAIALRNAELYAAAQQHARHQARVNAVGQRIQLAYDVEAVLHTAVQEIGRELPVNSVRAKLNLEPLAAAAEPTQKGGA